MKKYSIILLLTTLLISTSCISHSTRHIVTGTTACYVNNTEKTLAVACNDDDSLKLIASADSVEFYFENDYYEQHTHSTLWSVDYGYYEFIEVEKETLYNLTDTTKLEINLSELYNQPYTGAYEAGLKKYLVGTKYKVRILNVSDTLLRYFQKDPQMTSQFSEFYN